MGQGVGSDSIVNRPSRILYDPAHAGVFWESGIYNSSGAYRTDDHGRSFRPIGSVKHNCVVVVVFSDPQQRTLLAGEHVQARTVCESNDEGQNWTNNGATVPEG